MLDAWNDQPLCKNCLTVHVRGGTTPWWEIFYSEKTIEPIELKFSQCDQKNYHHHLLQSPKEHVTTKINN